MKEKVYITAQQLLDDAYQLGINIIESEFKPDFIVGIWRGGTPVGIAIQEILSYFGIETDHIAIRTSSYAGIDKRSKQVLVHGLSYIYENAKASDSLLIVDDVYDSGLSIDAVLKELKIKSKNNMPEDIRIATPWFKPSNNHTDRIPEYFIHETEKWLIFPHELNGLSMKEILVNKPNMHAIMKKHPDYNQKYNAKK